MTFGGHRGRSLKYQRSVIVLALIAFANVTLGDMPGSKSIDIDLTSPSATNQCEWASTNYFNITKDGLGWDGGPSGWTVNKGSLLTQPVAVGFYWRPATSVHIRAEIVPEPGAVDTGHGKEFSRPPGQIYARYSPDFQHWSTWQALLLSTTTNGVFEGQSVVPEREHAEYERLRVAYSQRDDIPWASDEEAAVKWIVDQQPDFFARNIPFVGYVQLLFEGDFVAGERFKRFKAVISYAVGGLSAVPKLPIPEEQLSSIPWRYQGVSPSNNSPVSELDHRFGPDAPVIVPRRDAMLYIDACKQIPAEIKSAFSFHELLRNDDQYEQVIAMPQGEILVVISGISNAGLVVFDRVSGKIKKAYSWSDVIRHSVPVGSLDRVYYGFERSDNVWHFIAQLNGFVNGPRGSPFSWKFDYRPGEMGSSGNLLK